jgi:hypothetical protein
MIPRHHCTNNFAHMQKASDIDLEAEESHELSRKER